MVFNVFLLILWFIISWVYIVLSLIYLSDYYLFNKMNSKLKLSILCCKSNLDINIIMFGFFDSGYFDYFRCFRF